MNIIFYLTFNKNLLSFTQTFGWVELMAIKSGTDEIYFKYFQQLFESIEKTPSAGIEKPMRNLSFINTRQKEKEFGTYINRFINNKLSNNGN